MNIRKIQHIGAFAALVSMLYVLNCLDSPAALAADARTGRATWVPDSTEVLKRATVQISEARTPEALLKLLGGDLNDADKELIRNHPSFKQIKRYDFSAIRDQLTIYFDGQKLPIRIRLMDALRGEFLISHAGSGDSVTWFFNPIASASENLKELERRLASVTKSEGATAALYDHWVPSAEAAVPALLAVYAIGAVITELGCVTWVDLFSRGASGKHIWTAEGMGGTARIAAGCGVVAGLWPAFVGRLLTNVVLGQDSSSAASVELKCPSKTDGPMEFRLSNGVVMTQFFSQSKPYISISGLPSQKSGGESIELNSDWEPATKPGDPSEQKLLLAAMTQVRNVRSACSDPAKAAQIQKQIATLNSLVRKASPGSPVSGPGSAATVK